MMLQLQFVPYSLQSSHTHAHTASSPNHIHTHTPGMCPQADIVWQLYTYDTNEREAGKVVELRNTQESARKYCVTLLVIN